MSDTWRSMGPEDQTKLFIWLTQGFTARWEKGIETYHSDELGFQGDPLAEAIYQAQESS